MQDNNTFASPPLYAVTCIFVALFLTVLPFTTEGTTSEKIQYETKYTKDKKIELGESRVREPGTPGIKDVVYRTEGNILQRIFAPDSLSKETISEKYIQKPIKKVVAKGTKKYQYMWCSDGGYRYFEDKDFKDPNTGYTSKSEDECTKNDGGYMLKVSNNPPAPNVVRPRCIDVTSYDYNWNNDMLCMNPDGSQYYTSYESAVW